MKEIIEISFKKLKQEYIEVQYFLQKESGEKNIFNESKLANDLSLWGDDNWFMLEKFVLKYNLDFSNFNYDKHFESEGELFSFSSSIFTIIFLPLYILKYFLHLIFKPFSKKYSVKINSFNFFLKEYKSNKIDLTMGDLITSKIQGKFLLRENVKFIFTQCNI